jgi:hypothetical protein
VSRAAGSLVFDIRVKPDRRSLTVLGYSGNAIRTLIFLFQLEALAGCSDFDFGASRDGGDPRGSPSGLEPDQGIFDHKRLWEEKKG